MAQELQTSVQVLPDGSFPMEVKLKVQIPESPCTCFLCLTDASDKKSAGSGHHDGDAPAAPVKPKKEAKPSPKAKALCPDELKGYQQRDAQNNTIC